MPQISVIVPVYKVEEYLCECIDSILAQTFTDFELILVDDGSPDNCGAICDAYAEKDSRVRVIHQENGGASAARNAGLDVASGEYIAFIDSDDVVNSIYLETLHDNIVKSDADIATSRHVQFEGNLLPRTSAEKNEEFKLLSSKEFIIKIYKGNETVGPCSKLFRRTLICDTRFPIGKTHEDCLFVPIVCYRANAIAVSSANNYFYRKRIGSTMESPFSIRRYDEMWAIESCIDFFKKNNEIEVVNAAEKWLQMRICQNKIRAKQAGVTVPEKYRVSLVKAVNYLKRNVPDDNYEYYLAMINPKLPRIFEYKRKIKKMLGIIR